MIDDTLTADERLSRYLSVEWLVAESLASELTSFAKDLTNSLSVVTKMIRAAHEEGNVYKLSSSLAALIAALDMSQDTVHAGRIESYGHYVELLGSRDAVHKMAAELRTFFHPPVELDEKQLGDGFDELLASLGGAKNPV